jgi:hypothetical protein
MVVSERESSMISAAKIFIWFIIVCQVISIAAAFRFVIGSRSAKTEQKMLPFTISVLIAALALAVSFKLLDVLASQTISPITTTFLSIVVLIFSMGAQYLTEMLLRK